MKSNHTGKIALIRHGQTHANIGNVWHGQTDTELTETGYEQIAKLSSHFHHYIKPDVIYASPLQRARLTAEGIGDRYDLTVNLDPRLMELHLGDWEGGSFETINAPRATIERLVTDEHFTPPNGESLLAVKNRFTQALEEIVQKHSEQNVVIVAHGIAIGITLSHYLKRNTTDWREFSKDNTAFSELCLNTNQLLHFNLTDHLDIELD